MSAVAERPDITAAAIRASVEWLANNVQLIDMDGWDKHSNTLLAAADRVEQLELAQAWQPIDTAPIGEVVLLCDARGNRWTDCSAFLPDNGCGLPAKWWMPLPEPPVALKGERS